MDNELIEKYISNELSDSEKRELTKKLKTDKAFADYFAQYIVETGNLIDTAKVAMEVEKESHADNIVPISQNKKKPTRTYKRPRQNKNPFIRRLAWAAAIAIIASVVFINLEENKPTPANYVASVNLLNDSRLLKNGTTYSSIDKDIKLNYGDDITIPKNSHATIKYANEDIVLFAESETRFQLQKKTADIVVFVRKGMVTADVRKKLVNKAFRLESNHSTAKALGTKFSLSHNKGFSELIVSHGSVEFKNTKTNKSTVVKAGFKARMTAQDEPKAEKTDPFLIAHWDFEHINGDLVYDISGNEHHGKIHGATLVKEPNGDQSLSFDGKDDYIDCGAFNLNSEKFTIMAWVSADRFNHSPLNSARIICKASDHQFANTSWLVSTYEPRDKERSREDAIIQFRLNVEDKVISRRSTKHYLPFSEWIHVACTYDGVQTHAYINGNPVFNQRLAGALLEDIKHPVWIGANPPGSRFWHGKIDDVRIYSRPLYSKGVQKIYLQTNKRQGIHTGRNESENLTLNNYIINEKAGASKGRIVSIKEGSNASIEGRFFGKTGTYDITVGFATKDDITSNFQVLLNGIEIGAWEAPLGGLDQSRTIPSVKLDRLDKLEIVCIAENGAKASVDYIDIVALNN